jgi:hypothetical protein
MQTIPLRLNQPACALHPAALNTTSSLTSYVPCKPRSASSRMKLLLPFQLLVATVLLTSTLGCSKKDAPAPPAPTAGHYKLGGQFKTCEVTTSLATASGHDYLSVLLTTTPEPSTGWEQLQLLLAKDTGQPTTAYKAVQYRFSKGGTTSILYDPTTFTLSSTSSGLSGTFTAVSSYPSLNTPDLTEGLFTNAPL